MDTKFKSATIVNHLAGIAMKGNGGDWTEGGRGGSSLGARGNYGNVMSGDDGEEVRLQV